jgi:carbamoyltransferase
VALNCVANGRLLPEGPYDEIWIQPAAGDAGGALGTALFIWHQLLDRPREPGLPDGQGGTLLGPRFSTAEIREFLDAEGAVYRAFDDEETLCGEVAGLLAAQKVVGWAQGRMEFGPRALGCRSILGDARSAEMQSVMNLKIKFRESFRPFAPSVLNEHVHDYFETRPREDSPYMLLVAGVREDRRVELDGDQGRLRGLDKLKVRRSEIPAVTHVDYSARVQTVDAARHGRYHRLIDEFRRRTGCPVVINTSFNVRGEPIVCTPRDAYRCFMATQMDVLVLEDLLLFKEDQPEAKVREYAEHVASFEPD